MLEVSAGTIIAAVIAYKLLDKGIDFFWTKTAKTEYVTKTDCKECSAKNGTSYEGLCKEVKDVKTILLIVAGRAGVKNEEIKDLVS